MKNLILLILIIWVVTMSVAVKSHLNEAETGNQSCNCTVNWGNQTMSVEDALERMGEGLSKDQTDEIRILINQSCGEASR